MNASQNLAETARQKWNTIQTSNNWFVLLGCYVVAGFILGFILKNFGRYLLWIIISLGAALWLLDLFHIATIHYDVIKDLFGISDTNSLNDIGSFWMSWAKDHIAECIAFFVGLFFAWELA